MNETFVSSKISEESVGRLPSIDLWRGASMALVIMSHLFFGLYSKTVTIEDALNDPVILFVSILGTVGQMFFFLSGTSIILSMEKMVQKGREPLAILKKEIRRGLFLILVGVLYDPVVYWHVGIVDALHMIGLSNILIAISCYWMLRRRAEQKNDVNALAMNRDRANMGRKFVIAGFAVVLFSPAFRLLTGWYPVYDPAVENLVMFAPPANGFEMMQAWITTSFFPVLPYMAYFFFGAWYGLRLVRTRTNMQRHFLAKFMIWSGIVAMGFAIAYELVGGEIAGDLAWAPYDQQPHWVRELVINVQPLTTGAFFLYLGMSTFVLGVLSWAFEVESSGKVKAWFGKVYNRLPGRLVYNTLVRFSYMSLRIYILQYAWIPVFRVLQVLTGTPWLYSIEDPYMALAIVIAVWFMFAVYAKLMDAKETRKRYTFESLLRAVSG